MSDQEGNVTSVQPATPQAQGGRRVAARLVVALSALTAVAVTAYTVWPTPYRYDQLKVDGDVYPVRTHRITGKTQVLRGLDGWVDAREKRSSAPTQLPPVELGKLDGTLQVTTYGWIEAAIYNGTNRDLGRVTVELAGFDRNKRELLRRTYELTSTDGHALSASEFIANAGFTLEQGHTFQWSIVSATWR